jgi:class 3 adenylate cyclase
VPEASPALDTLIGRLLAKKPAERPAAPQVRRELRAVAPPRPASMEMLASSIVAERPDLSAHAAPDGTVSILFSDIENYTALTERLGDLRAQRVLHVHNRIVREQVARYHGHEVKSLGDGFMVVFGNARRAVLCAIEIQRAFADYDRGHPEEPILVRMGLRTGETIRESGDFYGKAVIMAARIDAAAQAGEILVSQTFKEVTQSAGDIRYDDGHELVLKGLSGTHRVFRVLSPEAAVCATCAGFGTSCVRAGGRGNCRQIRTRSHRRWSPARTRRAG